MLQLKGKSSKDEDELKRKTGLRSLSFTFNTSKTIKHNICEYSQRKQRNTVTFRKGRGGLLILVMRRRGEAAHDDDECDDDDEDPHGHNQKTPEVCFTCELFKTFH